MGQRYVPALGLRWLDSLYDLLIRWTMPEREFKTALIEQARLEGSPLVLDLGCGIGTLMLMLKQRHPEARIVGLDGDDLIVSLAREKLRRSSVEVSLAVALADAAPFAAAQFDRVLTTLVLHHLDSETKRRALKEAFRVLRPGGELHIADWGRPHSALMRAMSTLVRAFDGYGVTRDNLEGRIPELCRDAGFIDVTEPRRRATFFGTLSFYRARKIGELIRWLSVARAGGRRLIGQAISTGAGHCGLTGPNEQARIKGDAPANYTDKPAGWMGADPGAGGGAVRQLRDGPGND